MKKPYLLFFALLSVFLAGCYKSSSNYVTPGPTAGTRDSLFHFAVSNGLLYTFSKSNLVTYNTADPALPVPVRSKQLFGDNIYNLHSYQNLVFTATYYGMEVYDNTDAANVKISGVYEPVKSCSSVAGNGRYVFATFNSRSTCAPFTNALQVIDISTFAKPTLVKSYSMTQPYSVAVDGTKLFVCDMGIKYYDATDVNNLVLKQTISNINLATSVVAGNGILVVRAKDGIYQYDYTGAALVLLSKINL